MFDKNYLLDQMLSFIEQGFNLVTLHSVSVHDGKYCCDCEQAKAHRAGYRNADGNPVQDCDRTGKHPAIANYTTSPVPYSEQRAEIEVMQGGSTGYGVLLHWHDYQLIVIDVDNHGAGQSGSKELSKLCDEVAGLTEALMSCGLVVETSNGGRHYYFKAPQGAYLKHLEGYSSIDIKVSGFVAGPGSIHKTGHVYKAAGDADASDITDAPDALIKLLSAPERAVATHNGRTFSADGDQMREMLSYMKPDRISKYDAQEYESYEPWLHVGMSIHAATGGSTEGLDLWEQWSRDMSGYNFDEIQYKWLSFGRSENGKTLGYLFDEARHSGWVPPAREGVATGSSDAYVEIPTDKPEDVPDNVAWPDKETIDALNLRRYADLTSPPGGVGAITEFILRSGFKPRPSLAVAGAIYAAGCAAAFSLKEIDGEQAPVPTNMIMACAAGSGTGKNSVINSVAYLLDVVGMSSASNGDFKSGQAITRALVEHQCALYNIDELGEKMMQVTKAHNSDSHSYLAGVIAQVMSMYSQSTSRAVIERELARSAAKDVAMRLKEIKSTITKDRTIKEGVQAEAEVDELATDIQRGRLERKAPEIHKQWLEMLEDKGVTATEDEENPPSGRCAWQIAERYVVAQMEGEKESLQRILVQLRGNYLSRPFLSMFGVTTGETFFPCMTPSLIKNGLWGRAMLFIEHDDAPWPADRAEPEELMALKWNAEDVMLRTSGSCANHFRNVGRVEEMKTREVVLEKTPESIKALEAIRVWEGVKAKSLYAQQLGATSLYNRGAELTERLAIVLAAAEPPVKEIGRCKDGTPYSRKSVMTIEHVRWAYAMIEKDTARKVLLLVASMDADPDMVSAAIICRVQVHTPRSEEDAVWKEALIEKVATGDVSRKQAISVIDKMIEAGKINQKQTIKNPFDAAMGASDESCIKLWWAE